MRVLILIAGILLLGACKNKTAKKQVNTTGQEQIADTLKSRDSSAGRVTSNPENNNVAGVDITLETRISEYFQLTVNNDLDELMNYVYPRIFEENSRARLVADAREGMENEDYKATIDSIHVDRIFSPIKEGDGEYAKVIYSNKMIVDFKNSQEKFEKMKLNFESQFGKENLVVDEEEGILSVWTRSAMVAVRDKYSPNWTFVNSNDVGKDKKIFSDDLLDKLADLE